MFFRIIFAVVFFGVLIFTDAIFLFNKYSMIIEKVRHETVEFFNWKKSSVFFC